LQEELNTLREKQVQQPHASMVTRETQTDQEERGAAAFQDVVLVNGDSPSRHLHDDHPALQHHGEDETAGHMQLLRRQLARMKHEHEEEIKQKNAIIADLGQVIIHNAHVTMGMKWG
jgi:hypothetical protein